MGWMRTTALGAVALIAIGYGGLAYMTREPDRPVMHLPVSGKLLLQHITVVNPRDGSLASDMSVLMEHGRIIRVDRDIADVASQRVDGRGKFVVPGFNDMHAHPLGPNDPSGGLALMLANGVTGFRQMSGSDAILAERRELRLPLTQEMPELLITPGALLTPINASQIAQVRAEVRHQQGEGADFIKAGLVDGPGLFAAIDEGKRVGITVSGHVPVGTSVVAAAQAGLRAIEHLGPANGLLIACSANGDRILAGLRASAKTPKLPELHSHIVEKLAEWALLKRVVNPAAADHDAGAVGPLRQALATYNEARCRRAARIFKAVGNWQVPTLIRLKSIYIADDAAFARNSELKYMSPKTLATWHSVTNEFVRTYPPAERQVMRQGYAASLKLVKLLDEEGVHMLAGSDATGAGWLVPGHALHQEFDELAKAGLSPLRILQMTTSDPADFLKRQATMGSVTPGRGANLVLLDGDPTRDVTNLHRIAGVVRAGFYYDARALLALKERVAAGKGDLRQ